MSWDEEEGLKTNIDMSTFSLGEMLNENTSTEIAIEFVTNELQKFLKEKNKRYGNSALNPIKVFSKLDTANSLYIRADDKISRIKNADELRKNDVADLMGYCVLICIEKKWFNWSDLID